MEQVENRILLRGTLADLPVFSHENHGKQFYRFALKVPRLSDNVDILPVVAPRFLVENIPARQNTGLRVAGQIRSHNLRSDGRRHLSVFVFASQLEPEDAEAINQAELEGILCREPTYRRTPLGREICDVMLAVPRAFRRTDYLPCILWGSTAQEGACCHTGDRIRIAGRLQSRTYTKVTEDGPVLKTTYEISALSADFPKE